MRTTLQRVIDPSHAFGLFWIRIAVGLVVATPESVVTTSFLLLFPLALVNNVFVDPATMPAWVFLTAAVLGAVFAPLSLHLYYREW